MKKSFGYLLMLILCISFTSNTVMASEIKDDSIGLQSIMPRGQIHCAYGSLTTTTKTNTINSESRTCQHGAVGRSDIRFEYEKVTTYKCTGCSFSTTIVGKPYWGSWSCYAFN